MEILTTYSDYLQLKGHSKNTVVNYTADIATLLRYLNTKSEIFETSFCYQHLASYFSLLKAQGKSLAIRSRLYAAVLKFCDFSLKTKLIKAPLTNLKLLKPKGEADSSLALISQFEAQLSSYGSKQNTIKNYKNDIYQFINWLESL
jgi:site-specific recombinase XerD